MDAEAPVITVEDDGVGMPASHAAAGHGFGNMRNRADIIGAVVDIFADASGTTVRLSLPLVTPDDLAGETDRPLKLLR